MKQLMKQLWKRHALFIGLLSILSVLAYPAWISHGLPSALDLGALNIPQRAYLGWSYRHWAIPFWNPFSFGGQPFLAAGQSGPLYLPNFVFVVLPLSIAMKTSYIAHNLLVSIGMYVLAYHFTRSRFGALLAGFAFLTSGFFLSHAIHTQMYDALAWWPLCFYLFLKLDEQFTLRRAFALTVVFAGEIYAGHPQMTFHIGLYLALYTLIKWVVQKRFLWKPWIGIVAGFLLAAPQWMETLHLVSYSTRQNVTPDWLLFGSMAPKNFLQNLFPFQPFTGVFGKTPSWESVCYFGVLVVIIGLAAVFSRRTGSHRGDVYIFGILALIFALLSLGANLPVSKYIVELPGFHYFRFPSRYVDMYIFSMCLLACFGVCSVQTSASFYRTVRRTLTLAFVAFLGSYPYLRGMSNQFNPSAFYLTASLVGAAALLSWVLRNRAAFTVLYTTLGVIELLVWSTQESHFVTGQGYKPGSAITAYITEHIDPQNPFQRVADLRGYWRADALTQDRGLVQQMPLVNGYDSLTTKWYKDQIDLSWYPTTVLQNPNVLNLLDVRYVIVDGKTQKMLAPTDWRKVYTAGSDSVWENAHAIQPAWIDRGGSVSLSSWDANRSSWNVDTSVPATLTISQSFDPNWIAYANGQRLPVRLAKDMLLSVQIPKGSYTLTVRYQPTWFYIGAAISALVMAVFLAVAIRQFDKKLSNSRKSS